MNGGRLKIFIDRFDSGFPAEDFEAIAKIHEEEIEEGLLSTLGTRFLVMLYQTLADSPHSFLFVARDEEEIRGFVCGSTNTGRVYIDFMKRSGLGAFLILAPKLFSPKRLFRIVETILYPGKKSERELPDSEILNFCVSRRSQRQGVGKLLFKRMSEEFLRRNIRTIKIVTGKSQTKAQSFYESLGAEFATGTQVHRGTESLVYTFEIPQESQES